jgi:hypothetical protein
MNEGKSIFSQLIDFLPDHNFRRCMALCLTKILSLALLRPLKGQDNSAKPSPGSCEMSTLDTPTGASAEGRGPLCDLSFILRDRNGQ